MSFLVLTLFILAMIAFAILRSSAGLRQWWRQRSSAAWPWAKIKVESGEIEHVYGGDGGRTGDGDWILTVEYSYTVEAQRYTGTYACSFPSKSEAADLLKSLRELPPPARYQPERPAISVLEPYRDAGLALQPGFGNSDQYF
ncbi:MAG: hypothetical protein WBL61_17170 [Bryobacteraceae bacterium]